MTETSGEIERGLKRFSSDSLEPFNCEKCGELFSPAPDQWIFYNLCDNCFYGYNTAKMSKRLGKGKELYLSEFLENES